MLFSARTHIQWKVEVMVMVGLSESSRLGQKRGTNAERLQLCNREKQGKAGLRGRKRKERKEKKRVERAIFQRMENSTMGKPATLKEGEGIVWHSATSDEYSRKILNCWHKMRWSSFSSTSTAVGKKHKSRAVGQACGALRYSGKKATRRLERNVMSSGPRDVCCSLLPWWRRRQRGE